MESSVQTTSKKAEIKEKIRALETERSTLMGEIASLKEQVEVKELEVYSSSLENEVGTLKIEKAVLEEKEASPGYFESSPNQDDLINSLANQMSEATSQSSDAIVQPVVTEKESTVAAM
jgi:hypothetical protein